MISKFEGTRKCELDERIGDVIRSSDYQTIEIKSKEGKVVSLVKPDMESKI